MAGRMTEDSHNITDLLLRWRSGQTGAADQLMELVYGELHQMAARQMRRERGEHTLQATAVVNEAYLRLCRSEPITWQDRAHFSSLGINVENLIRFHSLTIGPQTRRRSAVRCRSRSVERLEE